MVTADELFEAMEAERSLYVEIQERGRYAQFEEREKLMNEWKASMVKAYRLVQQAAEEKVLVEPVKNPPPGFTNPAPKETKNAPDKGKEKLHKKGYQS